MALDYAAAVNAEIKDLFAAGADMVQIDEPYMQARPEKARKYGLKALNAALDGVTGTTAVHICFGYAAIIHVRPEGYSFLPEFANSPVQQVSIETAQSKLDCAVLEKLPGKTILLGVLDLSDMTIETPETVAARIRRALPHHAGRAHHRRAGLRAEIPAARCRVRQDAGDGRGRRDRAAGTRALTARPSAGRSAAMNSNLTTERPTFVTHLECAMHGDRYEADTLHNLSKAGKPLLVRYDLAGVKKALTKDALKAAPGRPVEVARASARAQSARTSSASARTRRRSFRCRSSPRSSAAARSS